MTSAALDVLAIDRALCPRAGAPATITARFGFAADRVADALARMDLPAAADQARSPTATLEIHHPGRVGEILQDPDGAEWMKGRVLSVARESEIALA